MKEYSVEDFKKNLEEKIVVVDTSTLLLTGTKLLTFLPQCQLVIPAIVVKELEEKRSHSSLGFLAREWLHLLEKLRASRGLELSYGVDVPDRSHITLRIEPNHSNQHVLPPHLQDGSNDSTILAVACNLQDELHKNVVVLSNDMPMRIHATLDLKMDSFEFNSSQMISAKPYDGRVDITADDDDWEKLFSQSSDNSNKLLDFMEGLYEGEVSHELVSLMNSQQERVANFISDKGTFHYLKGKKKISGIVARTLEQEVAFTYLLEPAENLPVVSISGSAGTGKTLLSVAAGIHALKEGNYQKIVVFRSLHEMGRKQELGFLPGDVNEKMEAWAGAIYDSIDVISSVGRKTTNQTEVKKLRELVEISPITYLRGRSLSNCFVILDEAQNFSRNEILNILSRTGEGTKMVLCSDPYQVDNKFLQSGDKSDIWSIVENLKKEDIFAHITLKKTERSRVSDITSKLLEN